MVTHHTSKSLMMQALELLGESIYPSNVDPVRPPAAAAIPVNLLPLQQRNVMRLNESAEKANALLLANVVCRLAIEEKTKTLLITGQPSLTVLALNLLLYRAKIDLDKITSSKWYKSELDRLGVATRELVCAPLWVRGQMPTPNYITEVDLVMDTDNSRCLVLDNPPPDSIWQWQQLSREHGIPIMIVSADSIL